MLVRAGRKHARPKISQNALNSFHQLLLPWLCPAVATSIEQKQQFTNKSQTSPSPRANQSTSRTTDNAPPTRQLATAAEVPQYAVPDEHIPFEGLYKSSQKAYAQLWDSENLSNLKPFRSTNLVLNPYPQSSTPTGIRSYKVAGIPGDLADLQQNLYACVRVGRLDRAAVLARHVIDIHVPTAPEIQDASARYLTGCLESINQNPSRDMLTNMQKWLEIDIRAKGVSPSAEMLSIMIKATFLVLNGTRRDRTIRRYLSYAQELGIEMEVDSSSIFTDSEWATLLRLQPQRFMAAPEHVGVTEEQETAPSASPANTGMKISKSSTSAVDDEIVELRPIDQKGLGLRALKEALSSMEPETKEKSNKRSSKDLVERQTRLEQDAMLSAVNRWREEHESNAAVGAQVLMGSAKLGAHLYEWIQQMQGLLKNEIKFCDEVENKELNAGQSARVELAPFLRLASPEKLCAAAITSFLQVTSCPLRPDRPSKHLEDLRESPSLQRSVTTVVTKIGNEVSREIKIEDVKKAALQDMAHLPSAERRKRLAKLLKQQASIPVPRQSASPVRSLEQGQSTDSVDPALPPWSYSIRAKLGALFLSFIIKAARLPVTKKHPKTGKETMQMQPIASHGSRFMNGKRIGIVKTNIELVKRLQQEPIVPRITKYLPMIAKPKKWESVDEGAYMISKVSAVRFKDSSASQKEYIRTADQRGDMARIYAGLDALGAVPWRINKSLLQVQSELWNTGEGIAQFAPENAIPEFPPEPPKTDYKAHRRWKHLVKTINNEATGFHSQRCYQNFQLEVARAYANDVFYTPHNVDFRGRAYPIPPYFNHMGQDFVRGLFLFADGKELGDTGLTWLKIHLANTYGFDKQSLKEREQFAMDNLNEIYDSAENSVHGNRWWLSAEDPWQCLAACMELRNAMDSPVPAQFVSRLPIQQDGTCNGLQHYAALGGDEIGARQVNLSPGDRPADIYSAVAEMVKEDVDRDAAAGNEKAVILQDKIKRKIVKQPVMTNVYGVTYYGAKAQVRKQLVDIMPRESLENEIDLGELSSYIAHRIFAALTRMFHGAHAIQIWLGECGSRISQSLTPEQIERIQARSRGEAPEPKTYRRKLLKNDNPNLEDLQFKSTIVWTSPLGMPVVQPYRSPKLQVIKTSMQDIRVSIARNSDPVSKRKQLQGFPPNFIHSLDATHMMLSALKCQELGVTFSAVHDSFWTHASDIPTMNRILRDAFVRMHSEDIVGRLREEFIARYSGCLQVTTVHSSSELGRKIINLRIRNGRKLTFNASTGFADPGNQTDELLEEYERQQLLKSDDPEKQRQGQQMVTPASLFLEDLEASHRADVRAPPEVHILGETPSTMGLEENVELDGEASRALEHAAALEADPDLVQESVDSVLPPSSPASDSTTNPIASSEVQAEKEDVASKPDSDSPPDENDILAKHSNEALKPKRATSKRKAAPPAKISLWVPISFPKAPAKGTFDVTSLKDSQYFFS